MCRREQHSLAKCAVYRDYVRFSTSEIVQAAVAEQLDGRRARPRVSESDRPLEQDSGHQSHQSANSVFERISKGSKEAIV